MKTLLKLKLNSLLILGTCLTTPFSQAAIIGIDWQFTNDNRITRDTANRLDWLDLTVTRNFSYNNVISRMNSGGTLEGWRYASSSEVVKLWEQFGVDLTQGATFRATGEDVAVIQASQYLGSTFCAYDCTTFPYGTFGFTEDNDLQYLDGHNMLGAYYSSPSDITQYSPIGASVQSGATNISYAGSYLVKVSPVPLPASFWLFGSGILGLVGFNKRKFSITTSST